MIHLPTLYYITQPVAGLSYASQVEKVCSAGIQILQLRIKDSSFSDFLTIAREVKKITDEYGVVLIINDNPEIAKVADAHGVHLGLNDMSPQEAREIIGKNKIIGGTANTFERVLELSPFVDYLGIGPFRYTTTKKNLSPVLGIEGLKNIMTRMKESDITIPVYAIGGIAYCDFQILMKTGIRGIAVSSLIAHSPCIENDTRILLNELNKSYV